jgi:hypothetical protein
LIDVKIADTSFATGTGSLRVPEVADSVLLRTVPVYSTVLPYCTW